MAKRKASMRPTKRAPKKKAVKKTAKKGGRKKSVRKKARPALRGVKEEKIDVIEFPLRVPVGPQDRLAIKTIKKQFPAVSKILNAAKTEAEGRRRLFEVMEEQPTAAWRKIVVRYNELAPSAKK